MEFIKVDSIGYSYFRKNKIKSNAMNRKKSVLAFLFCLFTLSLFSQASPNLSFTVKGTVMDSVALQTIPYATVSISAAATPNVYLKRLASGAKGEFELVLNKAGNYVISFESVGMKKLTQNLILTPEKKTVNLGKINMSTATKTLGEVTVLAAKPLVKVDLDKISYDTKSDPESESISVLDMLKKVPLVTVDGNDVIQLKGSTNFKIYINGKASGMMTNNPSLVLKSMPASSIKSIEVITEPGAKYDAEGVGGIINIVTDHSLNGLTGTVSARANTWGGYGSGLYLSTKKGKFGLTANLNYGNNPQNNSTWESSKDNFNSQTTKFINQYALSNSRYQFYYGNLEASYEIDTLNLLSLSIDGYSGHQLSVDHGSTSSLDANMNTLSAYKQLTTNNDGWGGLDLSFDYQRTFKKPEQLLTLSYKFNRSPDTTDSYSDLTGLLNYTSYNQHIINNAHGDEHTFQVDYTEPFNKIHVIEFGAKYILRLNTGDNTYLFQKDSTQAWIPTPNQPTNNLDQTQNILGAYGSYTLKLEKFSVRAGLRYEYTGSNIILTDTNFHVNFQNLVPSVSMNYKLNDANNFRLSYNQRISRPGIWYLNPFMDNSNPFSISQGNPDLKPEVDNSISLNYSYITPKLNINTNLFTSFTNNSIERVSKALNDTVIYNTFKNIGLSQFIGLSVYGNWQPNKSVRINLNSNFGYTSLSTNDGSNLNNSGTNFSINAGGQFTLPYEIKFNVNGGYYSPRISLQGQNSGRYYCSFSLGRDFLNKKLNVTLYTNNPFDARISYTSYTQTSDYRSNSVGTYISRNFGLSVSYKFGQLKDQIKKVERTITNDDVKGGGGQGGGGGQ
jgi:outer membrane receptor protein involved in Fe transport